MTEQVRVMQWKELQMRGVEIKKRVGKTIKKYVLSKMLLCSYN